MIDKKTQGEILNKVKDASSKGIKTSALAFALNLENRVSEVREFLKGVKDVRYDRINDLWYFQKDEDYEKKLTIIKAVKDFFDKDEYVSYHQIKSIENKIEELGLNFNYQESFSDEEKTQFRPLGRLSLEDRRELHNSTYIKKELERQKIYFDTMFDYPLDVQQRRAIVKDEDNTLVVASAGSGKTSTIVAKARYLIEKKGIDPTDILVLTYTTAAAQELKDRIGVDVECSTFHSHACRNMGLKHENLWNEDFFTNVFGSLLEDEKFMAAANKYLAWFTNLSLYDFEYKSAAERSLDLSRYGNYAPYPDKDGEVVRLKSREERELFIILTELGLNIKYEYRYEIDTKNNEHRQYRPDFTIFDEQGNILAYLEHWGIDKDGNVPEWFGSGTSKGWEYANKKYQNDIAWKRQTHRQNHTKLLETKSYEFLKYREDMPAYILRMLKKAGIPVHPISERRKMELMKIVSDRVDNRLRAFLEGYVSLMKANQISLADIEAKVKKDTHTFSNRNNFIFRELVRPIYEAYEKTLRPSNDESVWSYDFTDMLYECIKRNREFGVPHKYKYILVDEYQDMSKDKYEYLRSLRSLEPFTKIFCVGDDWQSIYRFAGSELTFFTRFEQKFSGKTEVCRIEQTHRFGLPATEKSSRFILKNRSQRFKEVQPANCKTEIVLTSYSDDNPMAKVEDIVRGFPDKKKICILVRNWDLFNELGLYEPAKQKNLCSCKILGRDVQCMSIHAAKGLEADYVLLYGCNSDTIPSIVKDDPMLSYVMAEKESYKDAEERRVFYVAITRAKEKTVILHRRNFPSYFIEDLGIVDTDYSGVIYTCPCCKRGYITKRKQAIAKNGNEYVTVACSNVDAGICDYRDTIFSDSAKELFIKYSKLPLEPVNF